MPFNGTGVWSNIYSWVNQAANNVPISAPNMDAQFNDIANAGFDNCLTRDNQGKPSASFLPDTTGTYDLGNSTAAWRSAFLINNANSFSKISLQNSNSGTAAGAQLLITNGTSNATFTQLGTGFTTSGVLRGDGTFVFGGGSGGLSLITGVNQPIYLCHNNIQVGQTITSGLQVGDGTSEGATQPHFEINGPGYKSQQWLDGNSYYITQNSNARSIRVSSGNNPALGVELIAGATSWSAICDETQKDIISNITSAADKISTLRTVMGTYKSDENKTVRPFLIAQDVQKVLPEAVSASVDGILSLRYQDVIPLLVAAIKEIKSDFDAYKASHP